MVDAAQLARLVTRGLPPLRGDLELYPAPPDLDGAPRLTVHDPLSGQYSRLDWGPATVLRAWRAGLTLEELAARVRAGSTLRPEVSDLRPFVGEARRAGLLAVPRPSAELTWVAEQRRRWLPWLAGRLLFVELPLVRDDAWLRRALPWVRWLGAAPLQVAYVLAWLVGLALLVAHLDAYLHAFPSFLTPTGALAYAVTIVGVKALHELAHAFVALAHGVRVRAMGIALMVFWPVPFSDVTDAWRLRDRAARCRIDLAGVAAEIALAGVALPLWVLLDPGPARDVCFLVSSVTVLSTLFVNLNPAMRFDGYYALSDAWGVDNLRPRAVALLRVVVRRWLSGVALPDPEPLSPGRRRGMLAYAVFSGLYRVTVYLGIAWLIYTQFTKLLGLLLLVVLGWAMFVGPCVREVRMIARLRRANAIQPGVLLLVGIAVVGWLAWPMGRVHLAPAVLVPPSSQVVYAPRAGRVVALGGARGGSVRAGQTLLRVADTGLEAQLTGLEAECAELGARVRRAEVAEDFRGELPELRRRLARATAARSRARQQRADCEVRARTDGSVARWDEAVRVGVHVAARQAIGRVAGAGHPRVRAYVRADERRWLERGSQVRFYAASGGEALLGTVRGVQPASQELLADAALASVHGGPIPVRETRRGLELLEGWYVVDVELAPADRPLPLWHAGRLRLQTAPRSLLSEWLQGAWNALVRESGL